VIFIFNTSRYTKVVFNFNGHVRVNNKLPFSYDWRETITDSDTGG